VYVTGSSNFPQPLLQNMAPVILSGDPPSNPSGGPNFVFLTTSSCAGADAMFSPDAAANIIHDPAPGSAATSYAQWYLADGGTVPCSLGPKGTPVDVGESDVYSTTCNMSYGIQGTTVQDTEGPIQAMAFIVSSLSSQNSISRQAAREVFGMGGNNGVAAPWTDPSHYYIRSATTGTQQMIGLAIGVPPNEFWGINRGSAQEVLELLRNLSSTPSEADPSIGIISSDVYDSDRSQVKLLAYQDDDQTCAHLPDSTAESYDKQNVRNGQYPIWGPIHFFTNQGAANTALVQGFVNFFLGSSVSPAILDAFIDSNVVPDCAMSVIRPANDELSPLAPYTPPQGSCACYFLSEAQPPPPAPAQPLPPECIACKTGTQCPSGACDPFGFCVIP